MLYTMKQVCEQTGMNYETLKLYCKEGLILDVKRDKNNYRMFDEKHIEWIKGLNCLRRCGLSHAEMKAYLDLCLKGSASIRERQAMLEEKREALLRQQAEIQKSIDYIDWKQGFYDDVLSGRVEYFSNLIPRDGGDV